MWHGTASKRPGTKAPLQGFLKTWLIAVLATVGVAALVSNVVIQSLDPNIVDKPLPASFEIRYPDTGEKFIIEVREHQDIHISQVPQIVRSAFVQIRAPHFTEPYEFDAKDLTRGLFAALEMDLGVYRGCYNPSIVENLAHNALITHGRRVLPATAEFILAFRLRRRYSPEEITQRYLNRLYFGNGIFGVERASHHYFGKNVSQLGIHEVALLVALSEDRLDSHTLLRTTGMRDPKVALARRNTVLDDLAERGVITHNQAEASKQMPLLIQAEPLHYGTKKAERSCTRKKGLTPMWSSWRTLRMDPESSVQVRTIG